MKAGRREWIGLGVLALPCLVYSMDLTVLYMAVPELAADLHPSSVQLLWITDIYCFMLAGLLLTMGSLGDRIGRRRLLLIGAAAFGAASRRRPAGSFVERPRPPRRGARCLRARRRTLLLLLHVRTRAAPPESVVRLCQSTSAPEVMLIAVPVIAAACSAKRVVCIVGDGASWTRSAGFGGDPPTRCSRSRRNTTAHRCPSAR